LYGETKHDGEKAVLGEYKKAGKEGWGVVLRVPVLYGQAESPSESAINVLMDAVWKAQEKDATVHIDHLALRYPTNTEDVGRVCQGTSFYKPHPFPIFVFLTHFPLRVTLTQFCGASDTFADIAAKYIGTSDKATLPTILQFSSEDKFTKYEITQLFAEIMGLSPANIKPNTEGNDPNATVQRPYDCHLSTKSLGDIGIPVHTQDFTAWWRRECRAFRR
jgi:S-adenosylmethionine synthetase